MIFRIYRLNVQQAWSGPPGWLKPLRQTTLKLGSPEPSITYGFVRHVNACQLSGAKANVASSRFLLSRTLMVWDVAATSMQLPPLLVL